MPSFRDWYWDCSMSVCINGLHGGTQYILSKFVHGARLGEVVDTLEECCTEGPGQAEKCIDRNLMKFRSKGKVLCQGKSNLM